MLNQLLKERYQIISILASGRFGRTYLARDMQESGNVLCSIKQYNAILSNGNPAARATDADSLAATRQAFQQEAQTRERLQHPQIPCLRDYFQEGHSFFWVEDYIEGFPLSREMTIADRWNGKEAITFLKEILPVLDFLHLRGMIHQNINADTILRRQGDGELILTDFGSLEEIFLNSTGTLGDRAFGIPGYIAPEQLQGASHFSTDIYAIGAIAIQGLSKISPPSFQYDPQNGEILWPKNACSPALAAILSRMVAYRFQDRYQSAREVLKTIERLHLRASHTELPPIRNLPLPTVNAQPSIPDLPPPIADYPLPIADYPIKKRYSLTGTLGRSRRKKKKSTSFTVPLFLVGSIIIAIVSIFLGATLTLQTLSQSRQNQSAIAPTDPVEPTAIEPVLESNRPANTCIVLAENGLNIRTRPNGEKIGGTVAGERVTLTGRKEGNWVQINVPMLGWVAENFLQCTDASFIEGAASPTNEDEGDRILQAAFAKMEKGDLDGAIALSRSISPESSAYRDAQIAMTQWMRIQERYQAMQQALKSGRWDDIITDLNTNGLPESPYWQEKFVELGEQARLKY